jgi:hypothetical protein
MAEKNENEKIYSSIVDAFLDDRTPDWKEVGLKDAQKSGEEQADRTHQYVDSEFMDDIAESASHHTPLWPTRTGASTEKDAQKRRLEAARGTHLERMAAKDDNFSGVGGSNQNWRQTATQHPEDYKSKLGDDDSLFAEVTETLEAASSTGKVEKKNVTDAAVQRYVHDLLNQGVSPAKIASQLNKLAEVELFNHQMATRYLQDNAGLLGMAYLEPNTYMDKNSPTYERGKKGSTDSNDCVRQHQQWKQAGVQPRAASVKQISACSDCQYFSKSGGSKSCNLYHLPVVANEKELSPFVNKLTAGVPTKQKRAALVQIANGADGTHVSNKPQAPKTASGIGRPPLGTVEAQARRVGRVVPTNWDSSHVAKLHEAGHSLRAITQAAEKKFGALAAGKALREFTASLRPNVNGQIVLAKSDAEFLASAGLRNNAFVAGKKCASCPTHAVVVQKHKSAATAEYVSRVPHTAFHESNPDMLRTARVQQTPVLDASVIERYHKKGHSLEKIYKSASAKFGTAQASKAVKEFVASLKRKPIKVALSQIDCKFLKNKLADHNPIVGASKCGSCTYRTGMHCGLTGGTLLSFPGMDKTSSNHKIGAGAPEDGRAILNEYDLMPNSGRPGDVKMADIDMNPPERQEVHMGNAFEVGDIE